MKNNDFDNFDDFAKDAFDNFEVEFDPMDWVDMQSRLSAETALDKAAKSKLKHYDVPFDVRDWNRLEKDLDKKRHLYPALWWMKASEAGIVALLFFTFFNLSTNSENKAHFSNQNYDRTTTLTPSSTDLNNKGSQDSDANTYQLNGNEEPIDNQDANRPQALNDGDQANNDGSNGSYSSTDPIASSDNNSANQFLANNDDRSSLTNKHNHSTKENTSLVSNTGENNNEVPNQSLNGVTGKDGTVKHSHQETNDQNNILSSTPTSNGLEGSENTAATNELSSADAATMRTLFSVLEIPTIDAAEEGIKHTDPLFELKKLKLELPYACKMYFGGVATVGANFATSLGGTSIGYGAGLTFDSELSRKFALKSGVLVSIKKFDLTENTILDKTAVDGNIYEIEKTKTSNLVVVEVPLDVQYTFFRNEKWKIYVTAGISANLVGSRTYEGTEKTQYNGLSISTDINSNDYERGLLERGEFTQNAYLSVGGGLGLERQLGDKISLYILPTYRHAVTPIGTDFMSNFNVNIGVKTSL